MNELYKAGGTHFNGNFKTIDQKFTCIYCSWLESLEKKECLSMCHFWVVKVAITNVVCQALKGNFLHRISKKSNYKHTHFTVKKNEMQRGMDQHTKQKLAIFKLST